MKNALLILAILVMIFLLSKYRKNQMVIQPNGSTDGLTPPVQSAGGTSSTGSGTISQVTNPESIVVINDDGGWLEGQGITEMSGSGALPGNNDNVIIING